MPGLKPIVSATAEDLAGALGLSKTEAEERQVQYALLKRLKDIVGKHKVTHAEIAKRAGTSRTRVTAILNDDLEHRSTEFLIRILGSLGYRVRVSVIRAGRAAQPGRFRTAYSQGRRGDFTGQIRPASHKAVWVASTSPARLLVQVDCFWMADNPGVGGWLGRPPVAPKPDEAIRRHRPALREGRFGPGI